MILILLQRNQELEQESASLRWTLERKDRDIEVHRRAVEVYGLWMYELETIIEHSSFCTGLLENMKASRFGGSDMPVARILDKLLLEAWDDVTHQ